MAKLILNYQANQDCTKVIEFFKNNGMPRDIATSAVHAHGSGLANVHKLFDNEHCLTEKESHQKLIIQEWCAFMESQQKKDSVKPEVDNGALAEGQKQGGVEGGAEGLAEDGAEGGAEGGADGGAEGGEKDTGAEKVGEIAQ